MPNRSDSYHRRLVVNSSETEPSTGSPADQAIDTRTWVPFILLGIILLVGLYGAFKWWQVQDAQAQRQQAISENIEYPPITEFELTERSGEPFRSLDMKGRVWVVTYFFTTCPGNCIRLNQNIKLLHNLPALNDVVWVSVTCDPDTDTLKALQDYANRWEADPERWLFCRGELDYIKQIGLGMKLPIFRRGHKDYAVVFGKEGKIRGMFDATRKSEVERLKKLLMKCLTEDAASTADDKTGGNGPIADSPNIDSSAAVAMNQDNSERP